MKNIKERNIFNCLWPLSPMYYPERRGFKIFREMFGTYIHKISPIYKRGV